MYCTRCGQQVSEGVKFCPDCGAPVDGQASSNVPRQTYTVVSTGKRFLNYLLDIVGFLVFCFLVGVILGFTFALVGLGDQIQHIDNTLLGLVVVAAYFLLFEGVWGRTPGKFITKTKVVMHDGSKPDFKHVLGRTCARLIPFEAFSFLASSIGWHDSLSKTIVVPVAYTSAEVQQIDLVKAGTGKMGVGAIVAIIVVCTAIVGLLSSVVLLSLNAARVKDRDAVRIQDAQLISTSLNLYYKDNSGYPASLDELVPTYIAELPTAPQPPDGTCTADQNEYQYTNLEEENDYQLSFCLGEASQGHAAGVQTISWKGAVETSTPLQPTSY